MLTSAAIFLLRTVPLEFWGNLLPCPLRTATGIPCLGCGLTRAAYYVAQGDFGAALHANPLGTVLLSLFVLWVAWTALRAFLPLPVLRLYGLLSPTRRSDELGSPSLRSSTVGLALSSKARALLPWGAAVLVAFNYAWVLSTHLSQP